MIQCIGMMEVMEILEVDGGHQIMTNGAKGPHAVLVRTMDDGHF